MKFVPNYYINETGVQIPLNTVHQVRFVKVNIKNVTFFDENLNDIIDWVLRQANSVYINDVKVETTRQYVFYNETEKALNFYFSFKRPEIIKGENINLRTPRLYSQFDLKQRGFNDAGETNIFLGDSEEFKTDLMKDLFEFQFISGKALERLPSMAPLLTREKILLPVKNSFEILEACLPEYVLEMYGLLFFLLKKINIQKETVETVSSSFGLTTDEVRQAVQVATDFCRSLVALPPEVVSSPEMVENLTISDTFKGPENAKAFSGSSEDMVTVLGQSLSKSCLLPGYQSSIQVYHEGNQTALYIRLWKI